MKTTLDIRDRLLLDAKDAAAKRRTTLTALVEHALEREVYPPAQPEGRSGHDDFMERGPDGMPRLKRIASKPITSEMVYKLMEEEGV